MVKGLVRRLPSTLLSGTLAAVALVIGMSFAAPSSPVRAGTVIDTSDPAQLVAPATCGPGSQPEPALQGEVPRSDRLSGRSLQPYKCNLELVSNYREGEGASWQNAWYQNCDYYGTLPGQGSPTGGVYGPRHTPEGVQVLDVSDPRHPVRTAVLNTPAMNTPHESLKVNEKRGLLAAVELNGPSLDIYDISQDCAHPKLLASKAFPGTYGHEGNWAPDGLTYYGSSLTSGDGVNVFDVRDPRHPQLIQPQLPQSHGLALSDDGNTMYEAPISTNTCGANTLTILDVSQIQARKPNASFSDVADYCWADGAIPQHPIPVTFKGKPALIFVEEAGHGAARIIDISDPSNPKTISRVHLQVQLPALGYALDIADGGNGLCYGLSSSIPQVLNGTIGCPVFVYDGHYCSVDRENDPTALACGYFESGVRVFDIRDPANPKEIAYYNPGGILGPLPGSSQGGGTADHCTSQVRLIPATAQLWTQCQDHEFLVLHFTNGAWPFTSSAPAPGASGQQQVTQAQSGSPNTSAVRRLANPAGAAILLLGAVAMLLIAGRRRRA